MKITIDTSIIEREFRNRTGREIGVLELKRLESWFVENIYEWIKDNIKSFVKKETIQNESKTNEVSE